MADRKKEIEQGICEYDIVAVSLGKKQNVSP
jgi:hypothetical protein